MIYGLNNRNENEEIRKRYDAMVNVLSYILDCGTWDIETLFDSKNNIEVGEVVKNWVDEIGNLPTWNDIYRETLFIFASEHNLEIGKDIDIYTNCCLDTSIYVSEELNNNKELIEELEYLFNMEVEILEV